MTTPQDRPKPPLHNFSLPYLKWGNQRLLRCVKLTDNGQSLDTPKITNHVPIQDNQNPTSPSILGFNNNASAVVGAAKVSPFLDDNNRGATTGNGNDDSSRPWNLRTRRAACKAPLRIIEEKRNNFDSLRRNLEIDSPKRNDNTTSMVKKVKFSVPLLKEEIEQDFFQIARIRPPRRPKKRPRILQKYLDSIFPGLWLSEVTPDSYKVPDVPES
ncbi:uncharacterized protein LOC8277660 [Ricinus communis]|uniref:DUF1639 domain-containing protein n=1 Tax=Ricinus communis TaxID=3988 RepID=B9T629_RICCO|nr:uncharacterized protein LOC8277660 [Ricinus communis]EEF28681.1 conserved hypothetical protein [Ricinus communis]|eukprot:XP_002533698.1 uncharacterized protein LOC8277660 [Ricinus communis]